MAAGVVPFIQAPQLNRVDISRRVRIGALGQRGARAEAAAVIVASIYILGIIGAFAGPETMNQPLPEDERVATH